MRKSILVAVLCLIVLVAGCSNQSVQSTSTEVLNNSDVAQMLSESGKYEGAAVELTGRVFVNPERNSDMIAIQMFMDPKSSSGNVIVQYSKPDCQVKKDDYIKVTGTFEKVFEGQNAFGAKISAPLVKAANIEIVSYEEVMAPTIKEIQSGQTIDQMGLVIKVEKIEIASEETRVYVNVKNNTANKAYISIYDAKMVQNGKQFKRQDNYLAKYPQLPYDMLANVEASGIIVFEPIDAKSKTASFQIEAHSDDYSAKFNPYIFTFDW